MTPPRECLSFSAHDLCGDQVAGTTQSSPPCKPEDTKVNTSNLCYFVYNSVCQENLNTELRTQLTAQRRIFDQDLFDADKTFFSLFCLKPHLIFQWRRKFQSAIGCTWTWNIFIAGIKGKELMGMRSRPQHYCQALAPQHVAQRSGA